MSKKYLSDKEISRYLNLTGTPLSAKCKKLIKDMFQCDGSTIVFTLEAKIPKYLNFQSVDEYTNELMVKCKKEDIFGIIINSKTPSILSLVLGIKLGKEYQSPCFLVYLNPLEYYGFECDDLREWSTPEKELKWLKEDLEKKSFGSNMKMKKALLKRIKLLEE